MVIGPVMAGHDFRGGDVPVTGRTVPWNTFAIWNLNILALSGFPLIGDGTASNRKMGGVEVRRKEVLNRNYAILFKIHYLITGSIYDQFIAAFKA